ncbi:hypothetical protein KSP39_PZI022108 [Platanthera zijinensis]|uniref:Uncharacterized protein n=1 Tax=Platanthera zijinensis TaxID=2320716 RepID=A0AAP0AXW4_9ASPA
MNRERRRWGGLSLTRPTAEESREAESGIEERQRRRWAIAEGSDAVGLSRCGLTGPIPSLTSLVSLAALSLDRNKLNGTVPRSLESLPKLGQLNLTDLGKDPPLYGNGGAGFFIRHLRFRGFAMESFGAMREEEEEELRLGLSLKKESVDHVKCVRMISANFLQLLELWAECLCASAAMFLLCLCLRRIGKLNLNSQERNLNSWR